MYINPANEVDILEYYQPQINGAEREALNKHMKF